jgi:NADH-quinone oxidoreductase subunit J
MNSVVTIIFMLLAALALGAAVMVVTARNIIHAALWLIASFFAVAAIYMLLEAEFLAVTQVLIYVGAISILILFAIMLTRHVTGDGEQALYQRWWAALLAAGGLFGLLLVPTVYNHPWATVAPAPGGQPTPVASAVEIGQSFMREYLLPFTVVSVLLLVALVGAILIAYEERGRRRRVLTLAEEVALRKPALESQAPESGDQEPEEAAATVVASADDESSPDRLV